MKCERRNATPPPSALASWAMKREWEGDRRGPSVRVQGQSRSVPHFWLLQAPCPGRIRGQNGLCSPQLLSFVASSRQQHKDLYLGVTVLGNSLHLLAGTWSLKWPIKSACLYFGLWSALGPLALLGTPVPKLCLTHPPLLGQAPKPRSLLGPQDEQKI